MKPIIGVVGRNEIINGDDNIICIYESVRRSIYISGGIPIMILPPQDVCYNKIIPKEMLRLTEKEKEDLIQIIEMCDGIVLPGGNKLYEYDEFIYKYAHINKIPILGICAGMQLMGISNGENKLEKIKTNINHNLKDKKYVHDIIINKNTLLSSIIRKDIIKVNSKHTYSLLTAKGFSISAKSNDGIIEAIEFPNNKFEMGLQWHPESFINEDAYSNEIFNKFISKCFK